MSNISMTYPTKTKSVLSPEEAEIPQKSIMSCPLCKNTSIEIVSRCVTCKICGWSLCNA